MPKTVSDVAKGGADKKVKKEKKDKKVKKEVEPVAEKPVAEAPKKGSKKDKKRPAESAPVKEEPAAKKQKTPKVQMKVKTNQKLLLKALIKEAYQGVLNVNFTKMFTLGFIRFDSDDYLQRALDQGATSILGCEFTVKSNPNQKGKGPEALFVGRIQGLLSAAILKHFDLDIMISNYGNGFIVSCDEAAAKKAKAKGQKMIAGVKVQIVDVDPAGKKR